ncbi:hypothetical protein ACQKLX_04135 [Bosea sp. NPDC003192]|uniref:hypothetical protein n=1 Tax=Bosea sp. NPDC003192 TaxID=3390551 RepID=UPI003D00B0C2
MDAIILILEETYRLELKQIQKRNSREIDASVQRRGSRFPEGFVKFALRDLEIDNWQTFTEIERLPEFRELCRVSCFLFQSWLIEGLLAAEGDSVVDGRVIKFDKTHFTREDAHRFYESHISEGDLIAGRRVPESQLRHALSRSAKDGGTYSAYAQLSGVTRVGLGKGRPADKRMAARAHLLALTDEEFEAIGRGPQKTLADRMMLPISRLTAVRAYREAAEERTAKKLGVETDI